MNTFLFIRKGQWFKMNNVVKNYKDKNIYAIFKGFLISLLLSLIFIFLYAVVLVNTNIQESTINPVIMTITGISVLTGSSISSLKIKKNGILNGICVGGLYIISIYILSSIALCGFSLNISSIIMILIGMALGAVGGIIGVNFHKN